MGIVYASFGIIGIKNQLLCSTSILIHIKKKNQPQITTNNSILVSPHLLGHFFKKVS
jgi:hypothetical protein